MQEEEVMLRKEFVLRGGSDVTRKKLCYNEEMMQISTSQLNPC